MGKSESKLNDPDKKFLLDTAETPSNSIVTEDSSAQSTSTAGTALNVGSAAKLSDFSSSGGFFHEQKKPSKNSKGSQASKRSKTPKDSDSSKASKSSKRSKASKRSKTSKRSENLKNSDNSSDNIGSEQSNPASSSGQLHAPSEEHNSALSDADNGSPTEVPNPSEGEGEIQTLIPAPVASGFPTVTEAEESVNADILELVKSRSGNLKPRVRGSSASTSLVIRKPPSTTCKSDSFWQRFFGWGTQDCDCSCPTPCNQYDVVLQTPTTLGCGSPCAPTYPCCSPCTTNVCALNQCPKRDTEAMASCCVPECIPEVCIPEKPKPVEQCNQTDPVVPPPGRKSKESQSCKPSCCTDRCSINKCGTFPRCGDRICATCPGPAFPRCDRSCAIRREPACCDRSCAIRREPVCCNRPPPRRSFQKAAPPPPVFIPSSGGGGSDGKRTIAGLEKLKNVDIVEELTYCMPTACGCCSFDPCCCSNGCCPQCVTCGCCGQREPCCCCVDGFQPMGPIKYCRRQRFNFNERRDSDEAERRRSSGAKANPYDEIPVGKNPTPSDVLKRSSEETETTDVSDLPIEDVLPAESGTYYFNAERSTFAPVEEVGLNRKPPYVVEEVIEQEPVLTKIEPVITKNHEGSSYGAAPPSSKKSSKDEK